MPEFIDVHKNVQGLTKEGMQAGHDADVAFQGEENVVFKSAWGDPEAGVIYCLSEAPSADAVRRVHERAGHPPDEVHPVPLTV
jgi:hypothetical protein